MASRQVVVVAAAALCLPGGLARADGGLAPIVGGRDATPDQWLDATAVVTNGFITCTGVLIAPDVVLTAAHCDETGVSHQPPPIAKVCVGMRAAGQCGAADVEQRTILRHVFHPAADTTFDLVALVLSSPVTTPPRAIATGWAAADIRDGAPVTIVGWGYTDEAATMTATTLREATTTIVDADCSDLAAGCTPGAQPAGELTAGGMGVDTCNGDSGGPLYLTTGYGDFLAGITEGSTEHDEADPPCGLGGIYVRPDAVIDWLEQTTGHTIVRGPEPTASPVTLVAGDVGAETVITANDPTGTRHGFALVTPPASGSAVVRADGRVRVCMTTAGDDVAEVQVTDLDDAGRSTIARVTIHADAAAGPDDDADDDCTLGFDDEQPPPTDGGCCAAGGGQAGTSLLLGAAIAAALAPRRRRRWRWQRRSRPA